MLLTREEFLLDRYKMKAIISTVLLLLIAMMFCHIYNHTTTFTGNSATVEVLQWSADTCWIGWR